MHCLFLKQIKSSCNISPQRQSLDVALPPNGLVCVPGHSRIPCPVLLQDHGTKLFALPDKEAFERTFHLPLNVSSRNVSKCAEGADVAPSPGGLNAQSVQETANWQGCLGSCQTQAILSWCNGSALSPHGDNTSLPNKPSCSFQSLFRYRTLTHCLFLEDLLLEIN